jgi:hypothetical protein
MPRITIQAEPTSNREPVSPLLSERIEPADLESDQSAGRLIEPAGRSSTRERSRTVPRDSQAACCGRCEARRRGYRRLEHFYLGDPRRIPSIERDVGLWWREGNGPLHRAAWVHDTGELYLVRLGPTVDDGGRVEVLGVAEDRYALERALTGWRQVCGQPQSLRWLRDRAAALPICLVCARAVDGRGCEPSESAGAA